MIRRVAVALALVAALFSAPQSTTAQGSGWALTALAGTEPISGWNGPFRVQETGIEIRYDVLCYHSGTRAKAQPGQVVAFIPDGSTLQNIRTLSTTAIVDICNASGILVPRTQVLLPASQLGL